MKPTHILVLLLLYVAALSGMTAYLDVRGIEEPQWFVILTMLLSSSLIFGWYWADSTLRSYRRSPLLNVGVIAVALLAVPYYLWRSREHGQRLKSIAKLCGFVLLVVGAVMVGALLVALVG